ncbi:alpha/beta hydrolase [Oceanivirga salmonicida]|uniref:alpha/beta hydrolase n=1 Tax=Oceanivirga salmonicida TaxID=1769291 RepID=UPI0012E31CD0|nr:alpha/beta hydrolase [Oceanivirga salmonicida]
MLKKVLLGIVTVVLLVFLGIGNYLYDYSLNPKNISSEVLAQDDDDTVKYEKEEENKKWFLENDEKIYGTSVTGAKIVAHRFMQKEKTDKYVIMVHGYGNSAYYVSIYIKLFYDLGYNVLAPDLLGFGDSEGDVISMGGFDSVDLAMWANRIVEEDPNAKIVISGMSMGAATVLNSLNKNLPDNVKAFIDDSGYLVLKEQMAYQLKKLFKLPSFPILDFASLVTRIRGGYFISYVDAREGLKNTNLKGLILHGDIDSFVPIKNSERVYELLKNKEMHVFKDTKHVQAIRKYNDEYREIIKKFLKENLR